jgi:oligopeptidase A
MLPLRNAAELPKFTAIDPDYVSRTLEGLLAARQSVVDRLIADPPHSFQGVWDPLEKAGLAIADLWSPLPHLEAVLGSEPFRACVAANQPRLVEAGLKISHNRALYELYRSVASWPEYASLCAADRMALDRAIKEFELSGLLLPDNSRKRFVEIQMRLSELARQFSNAVVDATDAWSEWIEDEARLDGLPESDKAILAANARAADKAGWLVNLRPESMVAILNFAQDRDLRFRVYEAYGTRASEVGPDAGKFDNGPRILETLALRRELATMLGFADPVALALKWRMAENFEQIAAFLRQLADHARPTALAQYQELCDFARDVLGIATLEAWDMGYVTEKLRRERYAVDQDVVKQYFPLTAVLSGWRSVLQALYGIQLKPRSDVDVWHPDVTYYEVLDEGGATIAGLYTDLHARPGKRGGAWMREAVSRRADLDPGLPVAYLVCNFAPRDEQGVALLSHGDIQTLLHETGHCLHLLLTAVDRVCLSGLNGVEWDAIEVPSQIMEDFAWDRRVLQAMSKHRTTGETLPESIFAQLCAARAFGGAMRLLKQVEFALYDLRLHGPDSGVDHVALLDAVRNEVAVAKPPDWHRFTNAFTHIFAGGYAAGYYSYLWAECLAADGFVAFVEDGTLSRSVGDRFRREVLERGGTRPADVNFRALRGRDARLAPLLARYGLPGAGGGVIAATKGTKV